MNKVISYLQQAYESGNPLVSDDEYDKLVVIYNNEENIGIAHTDTKNKHLYQMYSLEKRFDDASHPLDDEPHVCETPKLDGAAISLMYIGGVFTKATKRGDGIEGDDCTKQVLFNKLVPTTLPIEHSFQITGEVVMPKEVPNARNVASGALSRKDPELVDGLEFIAYGFYPPYSKFLPDYANTFTADMAILASWKFKTVLTDNNLDRFKQDGKVLRVDSNERFEELGYTSKYPKGAYARKLSSDVEIKETELLDVKWQVGKQGQVTPVAILEEVDIEGAKINRATLHNAKFIRELDLNIGDTLIITRSGGIIPKVLGKV